MHVYMYITIQTHCTDVYSKDMKNYYDTMLVDNIVPETLPLQGVS